MDSDEERTGDIDQYHKHLSEANIVSSKTNIVIAIFGRESRGSGIKKHTVYQIKGHDRNGVFDCWRRFSEFSELRALMVKVWPGCLVPSLPSKNLLLKNEQQINKKRERYLNDFLKKMAMKDYLYYSKQFQALLRSGNSNISDIFAKWPLPSPETIISQYKDTFSELSGKQINSTTINQIVEFNRWLEGNQKTLSEYRKVAKEMAFLRDRYNKYYVSFFKTAKKYEQNIMSHYTSKSKLAYGNPDNYECSLHELQITKVCEKNPYWILYDLIKNEERDGKAFVEVINSIQYYGDKTKDIQGKIQSNVKGISEASSGKPPLRNLTKKGTPEEIKYELQVDNQNLLKDKEQTQTLRDIIIALVAFVQISNYKTSKRQFYQYTMSKLAKYDTNFTDVALKIWEQLQTQIQSLVQQTI